MSEHFVVSSIQIFNTIPFWTPISFQDLELAMVHQR